ncbi:MAG: RNA 2',3'-cyclic phosphodiesterase [Gaiellales bacterium]
MTDVERIRLFVAVSLPSELLDSLDAAVAPLRGKLRNARWTDRGGQHLTMKFLGWTPADRLEGVVHVCEMVAASRQPGTIALTRLGAFPSQRRVRVLWMGVDDPSGLLTELAADLDGAFEALGFAAEGRVYTPHLTLARFKLPVPLKSGFPELDAPPHDPVLVERIELFRSHLSPTGARYEVIRSFRLGSSA